MRLVESRMPEGPLRPSVATIGFFDGVHRGHCYLIGQVREAARERGLDAAVVTFPVHPRQVMQPGFQPALLTTCAEKVELLAAQGLDDCFLLDFTPSLARLSARQFMALLKEQYRVEVLLVGHDHRFGHNRCEDFEDYRRHGEELGMEVLRARAFRYKEEVTVSSSVIRRFLQEGRVEEAAECLGYPYPLAGEVVEGYQVGRKIGFPTANLQVAGAAKLVPADGVYAVRVFLEGQAYGGMACIGRRPTLDDGGKRSIEVHIFHYHGNAYHQAMRVDFMRYMRPERKFDTLDGLVAQLHKDAEMAQTLLLAF